MKEEVKTLPVSKALDRTAEALSKIEWEMPPGDNRHRLHMEIAMIQALAARVRKELE